LGQKALENGALYAVEKTEPMEERIEFALKAMRTLNFRALCQDYGMSAEIGYKWKERFCVRAWAG
jgi:hypothetical protein